MKQLVFLAVAPLLLAQPAPAPPPPTWLCGLPDSREPITPLGPRAPYGRKADIA